MTQTESRDHTYECRVILQAEQYFRKTLWNVNKLQFGYLIDNRMETILLRKYFIKWLSDEFDIQIIDISYDRSDQFCPDSEYQLVDWDDEKMVLLKMTI